MNFWAALPRPIIGLSPMDGVTDAAFRAIVATHGKPDVVFTEFTHVNDVCRGPEVLLENLIYSEDERPIVAQLYGKEPELFYQAAHAVGELGFDGLDINMGCPSKSVASSGSGAALIRTPHLAQAILQAARRGLDDWAAGHTLEQAGFKPARILALRRLRTALGQPNVPRRLLPLSIKTRLGYDTVVVESWMEHLLKEQPAAISLHGRTLAQMYRGAADWEAIRRAAEIVRGSGTLLLGNGDVQSWQEAAERVRETGVDGVLVGRGALGAPWFFQCKERVRAAIGGGFEPAITDAPALERRFAVMFDHARRFTMLFGEGQFRRMRKHLGWYCKSFPHAAALRARMFRVSSLSELEQVIAEYHARRIVGDEPGPVPDDGLALSSRCS